MIKGWRKLEHESRINNERRKGEWRRCMVVVPIDDRLFDGRPVVAVRDRSRTGGKLAVSTLPCAFQSARNEEVVSRSLVIPRLSKPVNAYSSRSSIYDAFFSSANESLENG